MGNKLVLPGVTGKKSGSAFVRNIGNNIDAISQLFPGGIRVVMRESSNTDLLDSCVPIAEKIVGDLTDCEMLKIAFQDTDTVVHIAGIHWSRTIVDAAISCGVRRLILVHTTGVYSKYKKASEEYKQIDKYVHSECQKYNIALTILRPTMIYGNIYDNNVVVFIKMVDRLPLMPVVNNAQYELQPVHYEDLGDAYFQVLLNEQNTVGRDFILSGGAPIYLRDMLIEIGNNLGKTVHFISCPFILAFIGAWALYIVSFKRNDYREKVQRLCEPRFFSCKEASESFGYSPRTFQIGIVNEVREYQNCNNGTNR